VFNFLYTAVSWVLLQWHHLFTALGMSKDSGLNWALSIVFLVITARLLLFRLFIKQVHYQRDMQKMQPKIQALREKYKNDKAEMQRQMMKLQQEEGFNPLAGCLPMLLQIPVFLGLFHVLRHLSNSVGRGLTDPKVKIYSFTPHETLSAAHAKLFNAPLAASFHDASNLIVKLGGTPSTTRWVIAVLLVISAAATAGTQLLVRLNQTVPAEGTAATVQRVMLYVIPLGVLASGLLFNFPLGVLLYWFTSNIWTLAQQAYIIRFHPQEPEPATAVGAVGRTLAPKPGQRPVRTTKNPPARTPQPAPEPADDLADGVVDTATPGGADAAPPPPRSAPRPGQRPNRGNRPPAKRPSQAKKRR
jgi:YidC/Oxa1 family membrane protein insertase